MSTVAVPPLMVAVSLAPGYALLQLFHWVVSLQLPVPPFQEQDAALAFSEKTIRKKAAKTQIKIALRIETSTFI